MILRTISTTGLAGITLLVVSCTVEGTRHETYPVEYSSARSPVMELAVAANPAAEAHRLSAPRPVAHRWRPPPKAKARPRRKRAAMPVEIRADTFVGLSEFDVVTRLGPDHARIISSPAQIMEYKFKQCHVTLYLYMNIETNIYRVLHVETKPAGRKSSTRSRCVAMRTAAESRESGGIDASQRS